MATMFHRDNGSDENTDVRISLVSSDSNTIWYLESFNRSRFTKIRISSIAWTIFACTKDFGRSPTIVFQSENSQESARESFKLTKTRLSGSCSLNRSCRTVPDTSPGIVRGVVTVLFLYFHAVVPSRTEFYSSVSHAVGGRATSPRSPTPLFHAMGGNGGGGGGSGAPAGSRLATLNLDESRHQASQQQKQESPAGSGSSTPAGIVCSNCDRVIV